MTNHSVCGILKRDGSDCDKSVAPGSPFNVCVKHYAAISEYLSFARSAAGGTARLRNQRCPACGLQGAVVASIASGKATCASCQHSIPVEELNQFGIRYTPKLTERPTVQPTSTSVVYYIRFGDRIKIGTSHNLASRLASLPYDELLLTEPGSYELEQQRHRQFNRHLIAGREWFKAAPDLLDFIAQRRAALAA